MNTNTDRNKFNEALTSLIEYSRANAGHVSSEDIKIHFKEIIEEEEHFSAIYDYLKSSGIAIDDIPGYDKISVHKANTDSEVISDNGDTSAAEYTSSNEYTSDSEITSDRGYARGKEFTPNPEVIKNNSHPKFNSDTEKELIEMYLEEIDNINGTSASDGDFNNLLAGAANGDTEMVNRLIESCLPIVTEIASEYSNTSLSMGDLIQEGNLGLTTAIYNMNDTADFDVYIRASIRQSIEEACNMQNHSDLIGSHLANRLNALDEASSRLSDTLGNAPSKDELAKEMHISEDEVDILLRTSLNVLTVDAEKNNRGED